MSILTHVGQIDHDLDNLDETCRYDVLCRICTVRIQPRTHVLLIDHADITAPTQ